MVSGACTHAGTWAPPRVFGLCRFEQQPGHLCLDSDGPSQLRTTPQGPQVEALRWFPLTSNRTTQNALHHFYNSCFWRDGGSPPSSPLDFTLYPHPTVNAVRISSTAIQVPRQAPETQRQGSESTEDDCGPCAATTPALGKRRPGAGLRRCQHSQTEPWSPSSSAVTSLSHQGTCLSTAPRPELSADWPHHDWFAAS